MAKGLRRTVVEGKVAWSADLWLMRAEGKLCEAAYQKGRADMQKEVDAILKELGGRVDKMEATIRGK